MKLSTKYFSFRNRVVVIVVGVTLGAVSLLYTNNKHGVGLALRGVSAWVFCCWADAT